MNWGFRHYIRWLACEFGLHKWAEFRYNDSTIKLKECQHCGLIRSVK